MVLIFGEKYILYFLWLSWAWLFYSNAATFKVKRYYERKERTRSLCQTDFFVLCVGMFTSRSSVLSLSLLLYLCTYSCDYITVFIAEGKNGSFLKCGWIIHSYWDKTQWLATWKCSRPVCREHDGKITSFSNLPLFTSAYWPIYTLVLPCIFWSNWSVAERASSGW